MPREPKPCWDATNERWRTRIHGKTHIIGGKHSNYGDVFARFVELYKKLEGRPPEPDGEPLTITELVNAWLKAHGFYSTAELKVWPRAARWRRDNLYKWISFCDSIGLVEVEDLSPDNLKCFAKFCAANEWSPWTTRHYVFAAKRAWEWGTDNGWVDVKPIRPSLPKASYKPQDISPADVGALVRNLESNDRTGRAARLVRFCLETGCRPGEARLLRWGDVKIHQSIALLQTDRHKTGKRTGKPRTIYLTSGAFELLESMKPHKCAATQYVFVSRLGKPYSRDGLRHILSRRGTYPYALRHTWAQSSVDKGVPLEVVSQAMGHTSLSTTRCYAEVRSERVLRELGSVGSVVQAGLDAQALASKQNASGECETDRSPTAKRRTRGKSGKSRRAS